MPVPIRLISRLKRHLEIHVVTCVIAAWCSTAYGQEGRAVTQWLKKNAVELETARAGYGFADMQRVREMVGSARVVGLGEATHGTREFFQLKHRMLEFLVEEMGFTLFGIEASYPDCIAIHDYVMNGIGDPGDALRGQGFWTWDTEEVLDLIKWMRAYNADAAHPRKLEFFGFDIQAFDSASRVPLRVLASFDADRATELHALFAPMRHVNQANALGALDEAGWSALADGARALLWEIESRRKLIVAQVGNARYETVHRHAVVANQYLKFRRPLLPAGGGIDLAEVERLSATIRPAAKRLLSYLTEVDPDFAQHADETLGAIVRDPKGFVRLLQGGEPVLPGEFKEFSADLMPTFTRKKGEYIDLASRNAYTETLADAAEVSDYLQIMLDVLVRPYLKKNWRDIAMAANVKWIADSHTNDRIVIWAHNGHISKFGPSMGGETLGSELNRLFGSEYVNFGFSFFQGTLQAIQADGPDGFPDRQPALRMHRAMMAPPGTVGRTFAEAGLPIFVVDLRTAPARSPVRRWFETPQSLRAIGALYDERHADDYFAPVVLLDHFDCMIFVETTTRAVPVR